MRREERIECSIWMKKGLNIRDRMEAVIHCLFMKTKRGHDEEEGVIERRGW